MPPSHGRAWEVYVLPGPFVFLAYLRVFVVLLRHARTAALRAGTDDAARRRCSELASASITHLCPVRTDKASWHAPRPGLLYLRSRALLAPWATCVALAVAPDL